MKRARILVVEDELLVGLAIRRYLESIDYEVPDVITTGEKAVSEVRALEPNLVLMDIHLAGAMDGIEAAGIIKETSSVPVIYLTAYSDADTLQKAKQTEPFGYVLKPFDERALEASIEMALHKASQQEKLVRSKERLAGVLHSIGDGIIVAGIKGGVEYVNETAAQLLHLALPLAPATPLTKLVKLLRHRDRQEIPLPLNEVMIEGKRTGYRNCVLVTAEGVRRAVDLNVEPYRDEQDMVRGIVLAFRDVAEPRRIEGLVEEELAAAAEVHTSLLPENGRTLGGASVRGFLLPAAFNAGDIYNFYRIDDTHAGLYIIDIMGHGVAAASLAYLAARLLAPVPGKPLPFLGVSPLDPDRAVVRMNELFHGFGGGAFFTICYAVIDLPTGRVRLVRAGHPFPLVVRADGRMEEIKTPGYAVGISPRLEVVETEIFMERGDRLVLYSDGLTECTNLEAAQFTRERLMTLLHDTRPVSLAAAAQRVSAEISAWRGDASFDDDITFVGVEMGEAASP